MSSRLVRLLLLTAVMSTVPSPPVSSAEPVAITGVVSYQPDAKRPWRFSRYYVKKSSGGPLAEAVVALRGRSLRGFAERPAETFVIDQKDFRFIPETSAIRVGDRIRFTNSDPQVHNVRTIDGKTPFNFATPPGTNHVQTFDSAGGTRLPIRLGCSFHSNMQAWVFVFDHPFHQVTGTDGRFRLEGIPPGEYDLEMVHPAGSLRWSRRVTVGAASQTLEILVSPDHLTESSP